MFKNLLAEFALRTGILTINVCWMVYAFHHDHWNLEEPYETLLHVAINLSIILHTFFLQGREIVHNYSNTRSTHSKQLENTVCHAIPHNIQILISPKSLLTGITYQHPLYDVIIILLILNVNYTSLCSSYSILLLCLRVYINY